MTQAEYRALLAERRVLRREPTTLVSAVSAVLDQAQRAFKASCRAEKAWGEFAGPDLVAKSRAYMDGGVLIVDCADAATFEVVFRRRAEFVRQAGKRLGVASVFIRRGMPLNVVHSLSGERGVIGGTDGTF